MLKDLFEAFAKYWGIPEEIANEVIFYILFIGFVLFVSKQIWNVAKYIAAYRNRRILNKDLHPYFTKKDIYTYTRYYIKHRYQNVAPSEDEEPGGRYIASAKK